MGMCRTGGVTLGRTAPFPIWNRGVRHAGMGTAAGKACAQDTLAGSCRIFAFPFRRNGRPTQREARPQSR